MTRSLLILIILLSAAPAFSQTYVAAALSADLSKSFESTIGGTTFPDADREAIGWSLRIGTALSSRWGVELEFHRSGELDIANGPIIYSSQLQFASGTAAAGLGELLSIFPGPQIETRQRSTLWNASAWMLQPLGNRADLVILGGVGFSRVVQESDLTFNRALPAGLVLPPSRSETTSYGAGPLVGAEVRIRMTDHLGLTPGFRVQSLGGGQAVSLVLRPSVALGWSF